MIKSFTTLFLLGFFILSHNILAQNKPAKKVTPTYILNGVIKDESNEPIVGATVRITDNGKTVSTDSNGYYSFLLPRGTYTMRVSFIGYFTQTEKVTVYNNVLLDVVLVQEVKELSEVQVSDQSKDKNIASTQQGTNRMTISAIKKLPTLLGEVDIIRSLQTLPGVTTVGEGSPGFNVRGGSADQNLILMDDIPILNSSHLLGFYSVFNPDVVRDMTLYRGGTPPQFGGRVSSVLDIKLKEPNFDSLQMSGGVGILASRLMFETPLIKEKLSLSFAGRASYTNVLFPLLELNAIGKSRADFNDITTKMRWRLNERNTLYLTGYTGYDIFKITGDSLIGLGISASATIFKWKNQGANLRWNHQIGTNMSMNVSGIFSNYAPILEIPDTAYGATLSSGVLQRQIKADFKWFKNIKHTLDGGILTNFIQLKPGDLIPTTEGSNFNKTILPTERGVELSFYLNDEWKFNKNITFNLGLRYASFAQLGEGRVFQYAADQVRDIPTLTDTVFYKKGSIMKFYQGLEPRLAMNYRVDDASSIKLGYQRMQQFVHQISNTTSSLPTARWALSTAYLKPQIADQISLGYFRNFKDNSIEASAEIYYKNTANTTDFRSGENLLLRDGLETAVLQGKGRAYGLEVYIRKKTGRWTGWATYTYSRSQILVNSPYPEDKSFNGKYYATNFDKPHLINIIANYYASRQISFTANFTYGTGRPTTFPRDKYFVESIYIPNFVNRNIDRIPDYHRLDISIEIQAASNFVKRTQNSLTLAVYNVYAHKNAYSIFLRSRNSPFREVFSKVEAYRLSVIGSIVPSLTWNFKF